MEYIMPSRCPVCGEKLNVTKLSCPKCSTDINGSFQPCVYCGLDEKMKLFLDTFLKCRGNIKEVEKALRISYPTVKGLLDELIKTLFKEEELKSITAMTATDILDMLEGGDITADEAAELLKKI
jgi:hypothetical protein